jgi:hypothetical protein
MELGLVGRAAAAATEPGGRFLIAGVLRTAAGDDDGSDSARFNRPRWAAEWCTWLVRWWRSSAPEIHNSRPIAALNIHGTVVWLLQMCASPRGKVLLDRSMLAGEPPPIAHYLGPSIWRRRGRRFVKPAGDEDLTLMKWSHDRDTCFLFLGNLRTR